MNGYDETRDSPRDETGDSPRDETGDSPLPRLSKYKVLILPGSECLADGQLAAIRRFAQRGGGLVATGLTGCYDQWRRLRVTPGLADLLPGQPAAKAYEEQVLDSDAAGKATRTQHGPGRSAYLPALRFDGPLPQPGAFFGITNRYWRRPTNWQEFVEALRWAAHDDLPLRVGGPTYLVVNLVEQPEKNRLILHLVNYSRAGSPIKDVPVNCRRPVKSVRVYSPDSPAASVTAGPGGDFVVPEVRTYSIAVVELGAAG